MMADTASVLSYRTFPCCPICRTVVVISSDLGFPLGGVRESFFLCFFWFSLACASLLIRPFVLFQPRKKAKLMVEDPIALELVNTPLFQAAVPQLWNALPQNLRDITSVETFKKNLKTFLFRKAFANRFTLIKF